MRQNVLPQTVNKKLINNGGRGGGAVTLQLVDKDNRDVQVCGLSAIDPHQNCGLESPLCSRMLGLVKQVLPSRGSCWFASANGVVMS